MHDSCNASLTEGVAIGRGAAASVKLISTICEAHFVLAPELAYCAYSGESMKIDTLIGDKVF
jgi:hypothetical protein